MSTALSDLPAQLRSTLLTSLDQLGADLQLAGHHLDSLPGDNSGMECGTECVDRHRRRVRRSDVSQGGPAVLYLPLGGGGGKGCPSLAESAVVGG